MTSAGRTTQPVRRAHRRGMTLVEVIMAITILSMAMLGLANFSRLFQHKTQSSSDLALASDLATQQLETIKGWRVYSTLVSTYNGNVATWPADPLYKGFTRTTVVTRCSGCPTSTNDYVTVSVTVSGNSLPSPLAKTTIIASF